MTLHLPLVFHFNQHLNEFGRPASLTCYRGLLRVLRAHPRLPFNIHISGTLIHALQWLDPEPLQFIRDGLDDGQFELLGSTYAQNVPYATDDWDNARQIELHQRVIHDVFGRTPTAFWNPERCWRQSLLPVIAEAGYRLTLIEDHILDKAGVTEAAVLTTQAGPHRLTIVRDDESFKHKFNFAAYFGRPAQLERYLEAASLAAEQANLAHPCLAYAEDAEAMGLWGWPRGVVPNQTWHRLDQLLSWLENQADLQLIHLSAAPAPTRDLSPIPDGSAAWMDAALGREDAPYHEDGYADWFDFNGRSPRLAHYRQLYSQIREGLQNSQIPNPKSQNDRQGDSGKAGGTPARPGREGEIQNPKSKIVEAALHNYLVHQYEFGCIGIGGEGYRGWEGVKASAVLLRLATLAAPGRPFSYVGNVIGEGKPLLFLGDGRQAIVLTPYGGRLLYWFDLSSGRQWLGNQLAVPSARYESEGQLPEFKAWPRFWLPEDFTPQSAVTGAELVEEAAPTRLGRFLPPSIWQGEPEPFALLVRSMELEGNRQPLAAQRRGLVDFITLDDHLESDPGAWCAFQLDEATPTATFNRPLLAGLSLEKRISLDDNAVVAHYTFHNQDTAAYTIQLRLLNELCPDYADVVRHGRQALSGREVEGYLTVHNAVTGAAVSIRPSSLWMDGNFHEALLALEVEQTFRFGVEPNSSRALSIQLQVQFT
jgi:hypothetical protein